MLPQESKFREICENDIIQDRIYCRKDIISEFILNPPSAYWADRKAFPKSLTQNKSDLFQLQKKWSWFPIRGQPPVSRLLNKFPVDENKVGQIGGG